MTGPATIRAEHPDDIDAIAAVVEAAFGSPAEARLVAAIRSSDLFVPELSLVALRDETIVGHVMISHVTLRDVDVDHEIASLSPLAVTPDLHKQGIGSALVRAVMARADELGEPLVVLEGDPAYYGRFGFEPATNHDIVITLPSWAPPEAAQVLGLSNDDPALRGKVVYPPAFGEFADH